MTTRQGRKTCVHCRKPLDNGQALSTTLGGGTRWAQNSAGFTRVPCAESAVPAHAACEAEADAFNEQSRRQARVEDLREFIALKLELGHPIPAKWVIELEQLEVS